MPHTDWRITAAHELEAGDFAVELELGDEDYATALLEVCNRTPRDVFDPHVRVVSCSSAAARAWLEAPEHEYAIGYRCIQGHERVRFGRAMRLLRGELAS
jgi:hypothetical protein